MSRSPLTRGVAVLLVAMMGFTALVSTWPSASAATQTWDTDADFNAGTLNGVEVIGTGAPATVQLLKDSTDWADENPPAAPGPREGPSMVYDSTHDLVVLFGGYDASTPPDGYFGDTWEYDPGSNAWTQTSSTGPGRREQAGISFDSSQGLVVLFGGVNSTDGFLNDTWEYDAATNGWTQRTPNPAPPPLETYHLTFHSAGSVSRSILAGRSTLNGAMVTWAYDAGLHTWANRNPVPNLPTRTSFTMAYDPAFGRVVEFGGLFPVPPPGTLQQDTWEYNYAANSWTQTATGGPDARTFAGMSFRSTENMLFMFGGIGMGAPLSDTWQYFDVGGVRTWAAVFVQQSPPGRSMFGMTDQAANTESYVFGGILAGGGYAGDTWSFGPAYRTFGTWRSAMFDSGGANALWNTISWTPPGQPGSTSLDFQIAVSNDPNTPDLDWSFLGPNCDFALYFTSTPSVISPCFNNNRYLRVIARLISFDDTVTPSMDSVTIDYTVVPSPPYLVLTDPAGGPSPVPQTKPIFIRFSEAINPANFTFAITPAVVNTTSWSEGNSAVTISHVAPLLECQQYTVDITHAEDVDANTLIPNPLDPTVTNPFTFVTECVQPWVQATNPLQGDPDVPLTAQVVIDFSENMNAGSVSVAFTPSLAGVTGVFSNGTQRLTLSHTSDFDQCVVYEVNVTGLDLAGLDIVPGPVPNPWTFTTHCTVPYIRTTSPAHFEINVAVTRNIVVVFSEPMVPSTLVGKVAISPGIALTPNWSNNNQTLTLTHGTPFAGCTPYTVNITGGQDADEGNVLNPGQPPGGAPHPWTFMTAVCNNPFIFVVIPADGSTDVDPMMNITIAFSEAMDTNPLRFSYTITPAIPLVATWTAGNQLLTLSHASRFACGLNTVQVAGNDSDQGLPLVPGFAPNPFSFTPLCAEPFIISTVPADGDIDVALTQDIIVRFSEPMNRSSLLAGSAPPVTFSPAWSGGDTIVTLSHASPFAQATQYTMAIADARDLDNNSLVAGAVPNPWRFTTVGLNPQILSTDPVDAATSVPLASNVVVTFSKPMNESSVMVTPTPLIVLGRTWTNGSTVLILSHITPFAECTQYRFQVTGSDTAGFPLVGGPVPNPWVFTTACFAPYIVDTNPADGASGVATGVPVWVNFSKSMDTTSVLATAVPPIVFTHTWSNGDQTLQLTHATAFAECTSYSVNVTGKDTSNNDLVPGPVPNPWTFDTSCPSPFIVSTNPPNGATNVSTTFSITIAFSRPMDIASVTVTMAPPAAGTTTRTWLGSDTILSLTFSQPQAECTTYSVLVQGNSTTGRPLIGGPVPNPWTFDTVCTVASPGGLTITRVAPTTIHLSWNAVANATSYRVYEAQNRFAAFPSAWNVRGNPATTTFDAVGDLTDGFTHYYVVRAMRGAVLGGNSTMAVKIQMNVGYSAAGPNVRWFSLPYRSEFARASDIVRDIEGPTMGHTKIDVIARWNPATQSADVYAWFRGAWRGTDFTINVADGMWFNSVSAFTWVVVGTDRTTTLTFTVNAPPLGNINWRGVPYTGTYTLASDLVRDIEGGIGPGANRNILEVVKWDATTQTLLRYQWAPSGWGGNDFTISPGDGLYFRIVSNFTWQPRLVTPEVP